MSLVTTKHLLWKAYRGKYAVGAFNINNLEILQAIVRAGKKQKAPLILQTSEGAIRYAGLENLLALIKNAAENNNLPIACHLDHGQDLKLIKKCISSGYTSVMYDGSHLPFEENIKNTKKVVKWAHAKGVSVEAELGTIGGSEDLLEEREIVLTDPDKAKEFVKRTKCDALAVAIGTSHGAYKFKGSGKLDIKRLKEINKNLKRPLVLHGASEVPKWLKKKAERHGADLSGASGVPASQVKKAIENGITKVNTDTDLRIAFDAGVREFLEKKPKAFDPRKIVGAARDLMQKVVEKRIKDLGSDGKA